MTSGSQAAVGQVSFHVNVESVLARLQTGDLALDQDTFVILRECYGSLLSFQNKLTYFLLITFY